MTRQELIDQCNQLHREAYGHGPNVFLPIQTLTKPRLQRVAERLQGMKRIAARLQAIESELDQAYPEFQRVNQKAIWFVTDEDPRKAEWLALWTTHHDFWVTDWRA